MWTMYAHEERGRFWHVSSTKRWVKMFGDGFIVPVIVTVLGEGKQEAEAYYGWQNTGEHDKPPTMIWPHWTPFTCCFAYGAQAEVDRGRGRIVKLDITKEDKVVQFECGDRVRFNIGHRQFIGTITEDRGCIGIGGRRLFSVSYVIDGNTPQYTEFPADELELVGVAAILPPNREAYMALLAVCVEVAAFDNCAEAADWKDARGRLVSAAVRAVKLAKGKP